MLLPVLFCRSVALAVAEIGSILAGGVWFC
jgi:hypothetical protein